MYLETHQERIVREERGRYNGDGTVIQYCRTSEARVFSLPLINICNAYHIYFATVILL